MPVGQNKDERDYPLIKVLCVCFLLVCFSKSRVVQCRFNSRLRSKQPPLGLFARVDSEMVALALFPGYLHN